MKARAVTALAACALIIASAGCAAILEGDTMSISTHTGAAATAPPVSAPEVSDYEELKAALMNLVLQRAESGRIRINSYEDDVYEDIARACDEIKTRDPLGAYALTDITATATQYVSFFEVDAELSFKRTKKQIDSRVTVSTLRYLRTELLSLMSDYAAEAVVQINVSDITAEDIAESVRELYYENPLAVVMMPSVGVEMFPPDADTGEKLFELTFNYGDRYTASLLAGNSKKLGETVSHIVETVSGGDNDGMILLELARKLADSCVYNESLAAMTAEHGLQNFAATAYGALLEASAIGEGYAMAFKALCDELGFECHVVLGTYQGAAHTWNIVALEGDYYHIDVAMCSKNGIETAFLLRDEDMPELYQWDLQNAKACRGELTYYDFAIVESESEIEADAVTEADAMTGTEAEET